MQIIIKRLDLKNYKSHQELTVDFAERTDILGENAQGKSSIPESIIWTLYGVDALGSKLDPSPVTYEADETLVSLLLNIDGKDLLLGRSLKKGKTTYYINEVPSKATEFNEILDQMFDKDLFLSLFNPNYFYTLHWEKQRSMVLQYVSAPANKEVLKALPEAQSSKLSDLVKKHSLDDLDKIHRANKTKLDKQYIAAQSRTKTLKEQLEEFEHLVPLPSLRVENDQLLKQIKKVELVTDNAGDVNRKINTLQSQISRLKDERNHMQEHWKHLKNEQIQDTCRTCKQPLQDEAVQAVEADKQKRIDEFKVQYNKVIEQRKGLEAELTTLEYVDVSGQIEQVRELEEKRAPILKEMEKHSRFESVQKQVEQAEHTEKETLDSLNESIFIIDSIKDFRAKEAELQAEKVQSLFENLSINLFKQQKNGDIKPDFEIEMDGKGYKKLSLSESIRAGLELRDVLSQQSEIITPCFVDNAESITKFKDPNGQLIICRVVAGQELEIIGDKVLEFKRDPVTGAETVQVEVSSDGD